METTELLCWIFFGAIGLGYFVYGRRQRLVVPLLCGLGLMLIPYFVGNLILLLALGFVLMVLPFIIR